jgi:hypothetical protein
MSDEEKGATIAVLVAPDDKQAMHFIGVDRLERFQAMEAALIKFVRRQRALEAAWNEIDELVGRDG